MTEHLATRHYPEIAMAEVRDSFLVTPNMRRIVFGGPDLNGFPWLADALGPHVHLLLPAQPGAWPEALANRSALVSRIYTIRRFDPKRHEMAVDFVMHGHGVACSWASRARVGDQIGLSPRQPRRHTHHDYYLLLGDLTALPAISQICESLPPRVKGLAVVEVDDTSDRQEIASRADIELTWVSSSENMPLLQAVKAKPWPGESRSFIWAGTEARQAGAIRAFVRRTIGMQPRDYSIVDYWTDETLSCCSQFT